MSTDTTAANESIGYTYHVEPPAVGGKRYARCEGCDRELLCSLGGAGKIPHADSCPNARDA
jgi:hypothetical protein